MRQRAVLAVVLSLALIIIGIAPASANQLSRPDADICVLVRGNIDGFMTSRTVPLVFRVSDASPIDRVEIYRGGRELPSIRQLAKDLGLASGTVARAYRELEAAGTIGMRGRGGTFVTNDVKPTNEHEREELLARAVRDFAVSVRQLGTETEEALSRAKQALFDVGG